MAFDALGLPEDANARSRLTRVLAPGELKSSESDSFPSSSTNSDHVPTADHPAPLPQKDYSLIKDDQWESLDAKDLNGLEKHQQSRLETMHARLLVLKKQAGIIRDICARGGDLPEILACLDKDLASFSPDDFFQLVSRLNKDYLDLAEAHTKVKVHQMQLSDTK